MSRLTVLLFLVALGCLFAVRGARLHQQGTTDKAVRGLGEVGTGVTAELEGRIRPEVAVLLQSCLADPACTRVLSNAAARSGAKPYELDDGGALLKGQAGNVQLFDDATPTAGAGGGAARAASQGGDIATINSGSAGATEAGGAGAGAAAAAVTAGASILPYTGGDEPFAAFSAGNSDGQASLSLKAGAALVLLLEAAAGMYLPLLLQRLRSPQWWLSLLNCFSGGIFLAAGIIHLLPHCAEAQEALGPIGPGGDYPLYLVLVVVGYCLVFYVERVLFDVHGEGHTHCQHSNVFSHSSYYQAISHNRTHRPPPRSGVPSFSTKAGKHTEPRDHHSHNGCDSDPAPGAAQLGAPAGGGAGPVAAVSCLALPAPPSQDGSNHHHHHHHHHAHAFQPRHHRHSGSLRHSTDGGGVSPVPGSPRLGASAAPFYSASSAQLVLGPGGSARRSRARGFSGGGGGSDAGCLDAVGCDDESCHSEHSPRAVCACVEEEAEEAGRQERAGPHSHSHSHDGAMRAHASSHHHGLPHGHHDHHHGIEHDHSHSRGHGACPGHHHHHHHDSHDAEVGVRHEGGLNASSSSLLAPLLPPRAPGSPPQPTRASSAAPAAAAAGGGSSSQPGCGAAALAHVRGQDADHDLAAPAAICRHHSDSDGLGYHACGHSHHHHDAYPCGHDPHDHGSHHHHHHHHHHHGPHGDNHDHPDAAAPHGTHHAIKPRFRFMHGVVLLLALALHTALECIALGLVDSRPQFLLLFAAVASHKAVSAMALASRFLKEGASMAQVTAYVGPFCLVAPLSIMAGVYVGRVAPLARLVFSCFATGTFLYVGASEVIMEEFEGEMRADRRDISTRAARYLKFAAVLAAVALVAASGLLPDPDHH